MPSAGNFTDRAQGITQAGKLRRRLSIQQATLTSDGNAGATQAWSDVLNPVYGALASWKATDVTVGAQIQPVVWAKFIVRYQPSTTIKAGMRLIDNNPDGSGGTTYTIIGAVDPDGTQRQLHLTCQQIIPGT